MSQTYQFSDYSITAHTNSNSILQSRFFVGATTEDSVSLASDPTSLNSFSMRDGNLSWIDESETYIGITSEIDYVSTPDHYYMNLNMNRSADVGFIMNSRSRAIISNEWLSAFESGELNFSITTIDGIGDEQVDTLISGPAGNLILSDYDLLAGLDDISTVGFFSGGIVIDFGL